MQQGEHAHRRRKLGVRSALIAATAAAALCLPAAPALAQTGPVSPTPVAGTPTLVATGTITETIRQVADCGGIMYAVGSFTADQRLQRQHDAVIHPEQHLQLHRHRAVHGHARGTRT